MSVHYKFKNNLDHDTVTFDGLSISVADLKKSIMHQKKIGKSSDFDLQITNAQTKEVYDNDEILVPKNTSVIVSRVPVQGGIKNKNSDKPDLPLPIDEDDFGLIRYDRIVKNADLVNANSTEEDKVKAMITQSSQEYDPSKYVKSRSMTGPLPPSYTCFRCGKQGHWIKNCPTNNPDVKRSTGIPRSFMVPVDGPEHKGALLTTSGDYAVPLIDHQAYKEVKKEKPPFVPQDEPVIEPEPQLPEELLCMVCNDLLQDAVLIPCCGNSFCDECVRQVLLESDNHECPVCHENKVSPNNLIPNRFLRTAVANFKNERGKFSSSSMAKRAPAPKPASPVPRRVDSPQPSPDSTVESQSHVVNSTTQPDKSPKRTDEKSRETKEAPVALATKSKSGTSTPIVCNTPENATPKRTAEDDPEDAQPGTPLADEPPVDMISHHLPIQTIGHEHYSSDRYEHSSRYSRSHRDDYERRYHRSETQEPRPISTIETVTNIRSKCKFQRPPVRQQFLNQRSHREDRSDYDQEEYHGGRYEKKHERSFRRNHYERSDRESRYTSSSHDYASSEHDHSDSHYDVHQHEEGSSRRHADRYRSPPRSMIITPPVPATAIYPPPVPAVPPIHPAVILPPQVFAAQPPPPGASPINTPQIPSQPPPPGVGPPLLPLPSDAAPAFGSRPFEKEDPIKDPPKVERSIDDRMEEFQRKLEKRDREFSRDRSPRSRSRSSDRHRSRSSSRSRSFKSWTRSQSRSSTRTSRSRSRTPFSSRSRTRSFSPSRSRSWSKKRSYSRSRSRSRTKSRSRSRSRNESRVRRRGGSRDSRQWTPRSRGRSHSFSPKSYRHSTRRAESYSSKHPFNPPQYPAVSSYQSQYGPPPPAIIPLTVMRPPAFPPHHLHSLHPPPIQPMHSRPVEPYPPVERSMKYPPSYGGQYPVYDVYSQKYQQPKYDREQRFSDHRASRYDRRSEYPRNEEEVHHRIPGWVGDRSRDYKPRYRQSRDIRGKEIRELPHIPEEDIKVEHAKESSVEAPKKKEEKVSSKHKKHHHHHKSKESKKLESKTSRVSAEEHSDSAKNLVKTDANVEKEEKKVLSESDSKASDKVKDKKHKHKKHKTGDQPTKKKRSSKKDKVEVAPVADGEAPPAKMKVKKKKLKVKTEESVKDVVEEKVLTPVASPEEKMEDSLPAPEVPEEETPADKPSQDSDVLDIFAEDPEPEIANTKAETVLETMIEENTEVTDNVELGGAENIEETINSEEEEVEEIVEDENVLRVDVPGISKWEREESEEEESTGPQRRSSVVVSAEETSGPISSDIISRAENALLSKQFKPRMESREEKNSRESSEASSRDSSPVKRKEPVELKSVVNSEQLHSDTLQVIVSVKDKRSVYSRKEEAKSAKSEVQVPKRSRSEKSSHRYYEEPRRSVATYPPRDERGRDYRDKGSDRREAKYSPPRKSRMEGRPPSRERKEYVRRPERDVEIRDDSLRREERKRRFESSRSTDRPSSRDRKRDHSESHKRQLEQDLLRYAGKGSKIDIHKKFRAGSMESSRDSFDSYGKKGDKLHAVEDRHKPKSEKGDNQDSARRKHSPIKPPGTSSEHPKPLKREYHDELKFEPDYDEFSDEEEKRIDDTKEKSKRQRAGSSPEIKRAKVEKPSKEMSIKLSKPEKPSISSSSSAVSETDSSDSDEPRGKSKNSGTDHKQKHKKSKHKKHKKHKHKHKKKKSHKSRRD